MIDAESSASNAQVSTPEAQALERERELADRLELEIDRLRRARPDLDARIDRATNILVTHLSCRSQNVILVRVGVNGQRHILVASCTHRGAVYVVNPGDWSCSCPDYHRRGGEGPCKHVICCWLWRASMLPRKRVCDGCQERFPRRSLTEVRHEHHNEEYFPGDALCRSCADAAGMG